MHAYPGLAAPGVQYKSRASRSTLMNYGTLARAAASEGWHEKCFNAGLACPDWRAEIGDIQRISLEIGAASSSDIASALCRWRCSNDRPS